MHCSTSQMPCQHICSPFTRGACMLRTAETKAGSSAVPGTQALTAVNPPVQSFCLPQSNTGPTAILLTVFDLHSMQTQAAQTSYCNPLSESIRSLTSGNHKGKKHSRMSLFMWLHQQVWNLIFLNLPSGINKVVLRRNDKKKIDNISLLMKQKKETTCKQGKWEM